MQKIDIDTEYLISILQNLLEIPSPSGYTDNIVHFVCETLSKIGISHELTRRGGVRANLECADGGNVERAVVAHLDTLGAMVKNLKLNGRLEIAPVGTWSSRFAEGARVTIQTDTGSYRGTILPLKASGHTFGDEIDTQSTGWEHLEVRVDAKCANLADLAKHGFHVGDYVTIDPSPEITESGFINARHLDDKAGVAVLLTAAKILKESGCKLPVECHILFTISEEVGSGASAILHGDVAELVAIDNATPAPRQNSSEFGVTIAMMDSSGPFDYHLTHKLIDLCQSFEIDHQRDVFTHYRCDAASAIEAGNDIRTALICFGVDGSHGYERTHIDSLTSLVQLIVLYLQSPPAVKRDRIELGPMKGFPEQPI